MVPRRLVSTLASLALAGAALPGHAHATACPTRPLPLGPDAVGAAARVVLDHTRASLRPIVESAALASVDAQRGGEVRTLCGARAQERTVVVYLRDRALGRSESLAESVAFVSRFPTGYRIWSTT